MLCKYTKEKIIENVHVYNRTFPFRVVLGQAYRGVTGGFLLLWIFSVAISMSPHVCFILDLILSFLFWG